MKDVTEAARAVGLYVATHSPGDGATRYRFFQVPGQRYNGPRNGIYTALGRKQAMTFIVGYQWGRGSVI